MGRIDQLVDKFPLVAAIFFMPVVMIMLVMWLAAAVVESFNMKRKGFDWDSEWGGYVNRKTGDRVRGWT